VVEQLPSLLVSVPVVVVTVVASSLVQDLASGAIAASPKTAKLFLKKSFLSIQCSF
jgi:hypothetical protein